MCLPTMWVSVGLMSRLRLDASLTVLQSSSHAGAGGELSPEPRMLVYLGPSATVAERGIRPVTVRNAVYGIQRKLGVGSMQELVLCGAERAAGRLCRAGAWGWMLPSLAAGPDGPSYRCLLYTCGRLLPSGLSGSRCSPGAIPPFRPARPAAAGFPGPFPGAGR